jgi:enamine deaminase RidA (YjgF/YER057c/UK114 family)
MEGFMPAGNTPPIPKPGSRLRELGLELPEAPMPLGAYVEASKGGSLLFLSGILPVVNRKLSITGRLGESLSVEQGREAVRIAAMNALAVAQQHLGDLDRVKKLVKLSVVLASRDRGIFSWTSFTTIKITSNPTRNGSSGFVTTSRRCLFFGGVTILRSP